MSMSFYIRQLGAPWYGSFSLKTSYLPGKWQKLSFSCFHCVTNTHQDKISSRIQVSVADWLRLQVTFLL